MGDKEVLLSASTGANMAQIVNENSISLGKIFEFIKPWGNGMQVGNKVVWTRCRGIHLQCWTDDCFQKIVHPIGTIVEVDEATKGWGE